MDSLIQTLRQLEKETEKGVAFNYHLHLILYIIYFTPPLVIMLITSRIYPDISENIFVKIAILTYIIGGVALHFLRKHLYKKKVAVAKIILQQKLSTLNDTWGEKDSFKQDIIKAAKEIFSTKGETLNNESIRLSLFWKHVFVYLGIELDQNGL